MKIVSCSQNVIIAEISLIQTNITIIERTSENKFQTSDVTLLTAGYHITVPEFQDYSFIFSARSTTPNQLTACVHRKRCTDEVCVCVCLCVCVCVIARIKPNYMWQQSAVTKKISMCINKQSGSSMESNGFLYRTK